MSKVNVLVKLSIAILGIILLPSLAFSQTNKGAANVTELVKNDVKVGTGEEAVSGKMVTVHYTGWLYDAAAPDKKGAKFDSSRDRGSLFLFSWVQGA